MGSTTNCNNITSNNYICEIRDKNGFATYKINDKNSNIEKELTEKNVNIDIIKNNISLTEYTSNHYLIVDEKAHCSEKWEDWFCIPNYHNNNRVNKYPNTNTMSVGTCYKQCNKGYIIGKTDKCYKYTSENDLIYNPLAIIAILGTYIDKNTIGIRGSYLNDLYRVNNNDKFIKKEYVQNILTRNQIEHSYSIPQSEIIRGDTNQETFLLQIIESFIQKRDSVKTIKDINENLKTAVKNFISEYNITKFKDTIQDTIEDNIKNEFNLMNKIKYYTFDIERLDNLYGKDKNKNPKFVNIIAYAYNIMRSLFYDIKGKELNAEDVKSNISILMVNKGIDLSNIRSIGLILKNACYNCFQYNYSLFNKYLDYKWDNDVIMRISFVNNKDLIEDTFINYFKICANINFNDDRDSLQLSKFTITYYNNIVFYDHHLLSEYSDNTKYIIQLLIIFSVVFGIILFICFAYYVCLHIHRLYGSDKPIINHIIYYINYVHLFYKWLTFGLLTFISTLYLYMCKLCKYKLNIFSIVMNIFNICLLIYLVIYIFIAIMELLRIDYMNLLANVNFSGNNYLPDDYNRQNSTIFYYILTIYIIGIYLYSAYLIRYSRDSSEYDIISNFDADDTITKNYFTNIILSEYASNMISNFNSTFTTAELLKANEIAYKSLDSYILPPTVQEPPRVQVVQDSPQQVQVVPPPQVPPTQVPPPQVPPPQVPVPYPYGYNPTQTQPSGIGTA